MNTERWKIVDDLLQAALEVAPERRHEFLEKACSGDADLFAEIKSLLTFDRRSGDFLRESAVEMAARSVANEMEAPPAESLVGQVISHYRVLKMIGSGGMGSVWLAERCDGRFERKVAIKFIHLALAGPASSERFKREGRILGKLAHPQIAELIDGGVTDKEEPYLVLEYVEGVPITEYCDEHRLDIDSRVWLFLDAVAAVAHAHANLVVHRDIKPSNVLVSNDGQVKLLDFGIAKLLSASETDSPTLLTLDAGAVLTPKFAAPEQITQGTITTGTDIYALGVLLYVLLTGRHPAGPGPHSPAELVKAVLETEPPHASANITTEAAEKRGTTPEKLSRQLRGDLDTILGKALKKKPAERYNSVSAFADDLRGYLKHEPISARPDTLAYRTTRFVRRNFALVSLVALAVAFVIASLSTGLYLANRERKIAEQRFAEVRELANKFIDLDNKIRGIPGTTELRMQMVTDSLQYLSSLSTQTHIEKDLALEIAYAYVRVAHAQGDPTSPNLGQFMEAGASLNNAEKFVDPVLAQDPKNRRALFIATTIGHDRMALADTLGQRAEEVTQARKTASLIERFMSLGPASPSDAYSMAYFYGNVADVFMEGRNMEDAVRSAQRGIEISSSDPGAHRAEPNLRYALAYSLFEMGNFDLALKTVNQAIAGQETLAASGHAASRVNLADALCLKGEILGRVDAEPSLGRPNEALPDLQRALDIAEDLSRKDASDYLGRHNVAVFGFEVGNTLRHSAPKKALAVYDHGLTRIREAKSNAGTQRDEAELLVGSSYPLRWTGQKVEAKQRIERALELLHEAGRYPTDKIEPMNAVYDALRAQADDYAETGDRAKAIAAYRQLLDKMVAWKPDVQNDLRDATCLSRTWSALADLLYHTGQIDAARQFEAQRTELWKHWESKLSMGQFLLRQSLDQIQPPGTSPPKAPSV
ncbi:MAG TPA: serine/threonine-protein kinase [Terriglobales bacterium]|nr:serine/threonine-protein kinase [Terriglobales bacterium]